MDATLIIIDSDAELARAHALVEKLMTSAKPSDVVRLRAQARLIAAYEQERHPPRAARPADILRYLMDQHGLSSADMVPILGTASRVSEVLRGKKGLSMSMVQRLRARFGVPADVLLPSPQGARRRRPARRRAA
jgi:HTH-type transcriptional regulator/antitoxin HigA